MDGLTITELGKMREVDPRTVWPNEEHNFTPWLSDNIDLEVLDTERKIGTYELDIYARDRSSNDIVIIENQLAETNHGHLGQLLTYAAGSDAKVVVWIVHRARDEHRQAIDWLNRLSGEQVSFFLIRVKVVRIDSSNPAVEFLLEASPSQFRQSIKAATKKAPSTSPINITWNDKPDQPIKVDSWRQVFLKVIEAAIEQGIDPRALPIKATQDEKQSGEYQARRPFQYEGNTIWIEAHGSADFLGKKINAVVKKMNKSLQIACTDGTLITLPPPPLLEAQP